MDLSKVMSPGIKTAFIVFLKNLHNGWYGITNINKKVGFGLIWDHRIFKHLWLWMVYRGAYGYPWYGRKTYNIAIEPWSSVPDDFYKVEEDDYLRLKPGKVLKTKYAALVYKSTEKIKGINSNYTII